MPTSFPGGLDALTNPGAGDYLPGHALQHANTNDAVEALQAKVGIDNSAVSTSLDYRVNKVEDALDYVFDARTYGAVGDGVTDDAAALRSLFAAATASTALQVFVRIPAGTYRVASTVTFDPRAGMTVEGDGEGATVINSAIPAVTYPAIAYVFQGVTSYKFYNQAPAADIVDGARTVTMGAGVVAANGVKVGDLLAVHTTKDDPDNPGQGINPGAYRTVVGISGDTLTVDEAWFTGYALATDGVGVTVRRTNNDIRFGRMTINLPKGGGGQGLSVPSIVNGRIYNVTVNGNGTKNEAAAGQSFVGIGVGGLGITVERCTARDFHEPVNNSYGYGILVAGSAVTVRDCRVERCKHGITSGHNSHRTFANCFVNNDAVDALIEAHPTVFDVVIAGNRVTVTDDAATSTFGSGIWVRAHRSTISDNTVTGRALAGGTLSAIKILGYGGADRAVITGNRLTGVAYGIKGNEQAPATATNGLIIADNLIECTSFGVDLQASGAYLGGGENIAVKDNVIESGGYGIAVGPMTDSVISGNAITYGNTTYGIGIQVHGGAGATGGDRLSIEGNVCRYKAGTGSNGRPIRLFGKQNDVSITGNVTSNTDDGVMFSELDAAYATRINVSDNQGDAQMLPPGRTAAPTAGTFRVGTFVHNTAPAVEGGAGSQYVVIGWVCTVAGTPGTWMPARVLTGT